MNWLHTARRPVRTRRPARNGFLAAPEGLERRAVPSTVPFVTPPEVSPPTVAIEAIVPTAIPSDPSFATEWGLANVGQYGGVPGVDINATRAWDVTTGSRSVVVAVIDSGIDLTHPDLAANLWRNPGEIAGNGLDDDRNGFVDDVHGWDFIDNDATPQDGFGHGTHVAGIIGAVGNNGIGVSGVAWQVSLMALRVEDNNGAGSASAALAAIKYATMMRRDHGINVVVTNNSWELPSGYSSTLADAIRAQGEAGITFVAAAGNHGTSNDVLPRYPSTFDLPNVISVAAINPTGVLAGMSDYGATTVDIAAPGTLIQSTYKGGTYGMLSGTSMAAPAVSGTVALLATVKPGITVGEVRSAILGSATPVAALAGKVATGGRLNARGALDIVLAGSLPTPVPTPTPTPVPAPAPAPLTLPSVTLPFSDAFNRPNGPIASPAWTTRSGSFVISGGVAVANSLGASLMTLRGTTATNVSVRAAVNATTGLSTGLAARVSADGRSMYMTQVVRSGSRFVAQVWRELNGQWQVLRSVALSGGSGRLRFDVVGSQLSVFFNGQLMMSLRDTAIAAAGGIGMRANGRGGRLDNFVATRM